MSVRRRAIMQRQTASTPSIRPFGRAINRNPDIDLENSNMMSDWHSEWATAPHDPMPSQPDPVVFLNEPAAIDLTRHASKARRVSLYHWDVDHEPEGRRLQIKRREKKEREYLLNLDPETFGRSMERAQQREEVVKAAGTSDVIDLTGRDNDEGRSYGAQDHVSDYSAATYTYGQSNDYTPSSWNSINRPPRRKRSPPAEETANDGLAAMSLNPRAPKRHQPARLQPRTIHNAPYQAPTNPIRLPAPQSRSAGYTWPLLWSDYQPQHRQREYVPEPQYRAPAGLARLLTPLPMGAGYRWPQCSGRGGMAHTSIEDSFRDDWPAVYQ